jgi:predicted nucleic acid-binding Zn ribbon protein
MSEAKYICTVCSKTFDESELFCCSNCGEYLCPKDGGEIVTNKEYDKAMKDEN